MEINLKGRKIEVDQDVVDYVSELETKLIDLEEENQKLTSVLAGLVGLMGNLAHSSAEAEKCIREGLAFAKEQLTGEKKDVEKVEEPKRELLTWEVLNALDLNMLRPGLSIQTDADYRELVYNSLVTAYNSGTREYEFVDHIFDKNMLGVHAPQVLQLMRTHTGSVPGQGVYETHLEKLL